KNKTYNTRYSLVVTDPTTNPALTGLSMGERTGSRVLQWVWSYVTATPHMIAYSRRRNGKTMLRAQLPLVRPHGRALAVPSCASLSSRKA
ncbi:hypothetical protein LY76DRAFT_527216, partial [Colletotrichum caudatum]